MDTKAKFPARPYQDLGEYVQAYAELTTAAWKGLDHDAMRRASDTLLQAYINGNQIFVCGNGGSAAIAEHLECDHIKGVHTGTDLSPRIRSLSSNLALLTAIANDLAFEEIFAFPLARLYSVGDVLLVISSSGNSPNIVRSLEFARDKGLTTIAFTGFDGGKARRIADICVHVDVDNYGVVEDVHQGIMHVLAQYIRQRRIDPDMIPNVKF